MLRSHVSRQNPLLSAPRHSKEFKGEAVRLFKAGNKPVARLVKELGVAAKSICDPPKQADADVGNGSPGVLKTPEREELIALRKKCRELERERDFCWMRRHTSQRRNGEVSLCFVEDRLVSRGMDVSSTSGLSFRLLRLAARVLKLATDRTHFLCLLLSKDHTGNYTFRI